MKPLHIAIITNNYKPYSGGVVSSIDSFTNELIEQGHQVSIITLDFGTKDDPEHIVRIFCPIRFNYNGNPIAVPWRHHTTILNILKELAPDIYSYTASIPDWRFCS